jgi:hypothetical protein
MIDGTEASFPFDGTTTRIRLVCVLWLHDNKCCGDTHVVLGRVDDYIDETWLVYCRLVDN